MRDEGQRLQSHCLQPHYQAPNNSCSRHAMPRHDWQYVDIGNPLTELYHERWPVTRGKPGTIFVPTVSNQFFLVFLFSSIAITAGAAEPAAPCPHKAGTAPPVPRRRQCWQQNAKRTRGKIFLNRWHENRARFSASHRPSLMVKRG